MLLLPVYIDGTVDTVGSGESMMVVTWLFLVAEFEIASEVKLVTGERTGCLTAKVRQVNDGVLHFIWIGPQIIVLKRTCG